MPPFSSSQPTPKFTEPELNINDQETPPSVDLLKSTAENSAYIDLLSTEQINELLGANYELVNDGELQAMRMNLLRIQSNVNKGLPPHYHVMSVENKDALSNHITSKLKEVESRLDKNVQSVEAEAHNLDDININGESQSTADLKRGLEVTELVGEEPLIDFLGGNALSMDASENPNFQRASTPLSPEEISNTLINKVEDITSLESKSIDDIKDLFTKKDITSDDIKGIILSLRNRLMTLSKNDVETAEALKGKINTLDEMISTPSQRKTQETVNAMPATKKPLRGGLMDRLKAIFRGK